MLEESTALRVGQTWISSEQQYQISIIVQPFLQQNIFVMRVAVIGGGPSGLVTLKYLINAHQFLSGEPIEARLFESESAVGGTFKHRSYEDAEVSDLSSRSELKLISKY
jgi:hypothetical protein